MSFVVSHLPHLLPTLAAFAIVAWLWTTTPPTAKASKEPAVRASPPASRRPVRRETARRGMLALGPLLAALVTGAVIYGIDLGAGEPGSGLAWAHTGVSVLVVPLAVYKLLEVYRARSAAGWRPERALDLAASLSTSALLLVLLITGAVLLAVPSAASWPAYVHLIAATWWTGVVVWHLRRYLARSVRAVWSPAAADRRILHRTGEPE